MSKARVSLVHGGDRRANVFNALELVRGEVEVRLAEQVMLKPNFLSSENQLASSHVDALRGVLDFLLTTPRPPREVLIAEGGAADTWDAYRNFGYYALEQVTCPPRIGPGNMLVLGRRKGERWLRRDIRRSR